MEGVGRLSPLVIRRDVHFFTRGVLFLGENLNNPYYTKQSMIELLSHPVSIMIFAFITGIFTKLADIGVDKDAKIPRSHQILFGVLWGAFGALVVFGNSLMAAFYFGILLSWIVRYKLDYYNHGIGGAIILVAIWLTLPKETLHIIILAGTFVLFTVFGLLSRELNARLGFVQEYNLYSFLFLAILFIFYPSVWIVFVASLTNVLGYHYIKKKFKKKPFKK